MKLKVGMIGGGKDVLLEQYTALRKIWTDR